jgi:hypothetical protein
VRLNYAVRMLEKYDAAAGDVVEGPVGAATVAALRSAAADIPALCAEIARLRVGGLARREG